MMEMSLSFKMQPCSHATYTQIMFKLLIQLMLMLDIYELHFQSFTLYKIKKSLFEICMKKNLHQFEGHPSIDSQLEIHSVTIQNQQYLKLLVSL